MLATAKVDTFYQLETVEKPIICNICELIC